MNQHTSLFDVIERVQGPSAWGSVLDAGSGVKSALWISGLATTSWTAVSADAAHLDEIRSHVAPRMRPEDQLILGNWSDRSLLENARYDHVFADYLIGSIEGYAPYLQEAIVRRLRPLIGRRIYLTGVDPYLMEVADTPAGEIVQALGRLRDATGLLAGVRLYREYPAEWVIDRLEQVGLRPVFADRFPCVYSIDWLEAQIADCGRLRQNIAHDPGLTTALEATANELAARGRTIAAESGGLAWGTEYVIAAEPQ